MTPEYIARVRKDFDNSDLEDFEWATFLKGYLACQKRFGGSYEASLRHNPSGYVRFEDLENYRDKVLEELNNKIVGEKPYEVWLALTECLEAVRYLPLKTNL